MKNLDDKKLVAVYTDIGRGHPNYLDSTLRAIESSVSTTNHILPIEAWTEKFIFPPFDFKIANRLVTNFHAPKSPFFISVSAFGGYDLIKHAYDVAIKEKYRFLDYGDVMLIL